MSVYESSFAVLSNPKGIIATKKELITESSDQSDESTIAPHTPSENQAPSEPRPPHISWNIQQVNNTFFGPVNGAFDGGLDSAMLELSHNNIGISILPYISDS